MLLYRGLPSANMGLEASGYRRVKQFFNAPSLHIFLNYITQLLESASLQGFRRNHGQEYSDLELLAELQHNGAATCLVDFTTNPLVALWFACQNIQQENGKVIAMRTDNIEEFAEVNYENLKSPIGKFFEEGKLWKWRPSHQNNRILAQNSIFVFGQGEIQDRYYVSIEIENKEKIVEELQTKFGISELYLFSDLTGFSLSNAHDKPYNYTLEDYFNLGVTFGQRGEYGMAIKYYTEAIKINPQLAEAYNNRGNAEHFLSNHLDAIKDYDEAIKVNSKYAQAYNNRGIAKRALGDNSGALKDYDEAIRINPQFAEAYNGRGNVKHILGNRIDAIKDYDKSIKITPQNFSAYNNRGNVKHTLGDSPGAIKDCDEAIRINPQFAEAYNNRGNAKHTLGDSFGAIKDFDEAIKIDPSYFLAYSNRGNARHNLGDIDGAIGDYDNAIRISSQFAEAYHNRGNAKYALGDSSGAIDDYDEAIRINPQFAGTYYNRGNVKRTLGNEAGADKDYAMAKKIDPVNFSEKIGETMLSATDLTTQRRQGND